MPTYNENHYEQTLIQLFTQRLEYDYLNGYDIQSRYAEKDYYCPVYQDWLSLMLKKLNPALPSTALEEAERKLLHIEAGNMVQNNELFTDLLDATRNVLISIIQRNFQSNSSILLMKNSMGVLVRNSV